MALTLDHTEYYIGYQCHTVDACSALYERYGPGRNQFRDQFRATTQFTNNKHILLNYANPFARPKELWTTRRTLLNSYISTRRFWRQSFHDFGTTPRGFKVVYNRIAQSPFAAQPDHLWAPEPGQRQAYMEHISTICNMTPSCDDE